MTEIQQTYTAFEATKLLTQGPLEEVALAVKKYRKKNATTPILVFSDNTGKEMDLDLRGSDEDVLRRLKVFVQSAQETPTNGPGRPKLGVVAREISLLPRHWEWLSTQTGGASAIIRKLVDNEIKKSSHREPIRQAQERTYKFMSAIAGNLPCYEEALRALYARDKKKFVDQIKNWPVDIAKHTQYLAKDVFI